MTAVASHTTAKLDRTTISPSSFGVVDTAPLAFAELVGPAARVVEPVPGAAVGADVVAGPPPPSPPMVLEHQKE